MVSSVRAFGPRETSSTSARPRQEPSVVFLSPTGAIGGAERVLLDLVQSLVAMSAPSRITVITSAEGPLVDAVRSTGATALVVPFPDVIAQLGDAGIGSVRSFLSFCTRLAQGLPAAQRYAKQLRRVLQSLSPDIVHSNGAKMHVFSSFASKGIAPLVWHLHDYPGSRAVMRRLLQWRQSSAAALIANSQSVASDARDVFGTRTAVHTVPNGVDLERFRPHGPALDLDALAGSPQRAESVVRIGLVATYARWKGHDIFFRALAMLPADLPWHAYVIGGQVYETRNSQHTRASLELLAGRTGIGERVTFTGPVADVPSALRALDIVVHASTLPEPFGLTIAEAMACGRPVVTSGSGGAIEVAQAGPGAEVVPFRDVEALALAIGSLISSAEQRHTAGGAARVTAQRVHSREHMVAGVRQVHASLAPRGNRPS